jgi:hypothetical protein
LKPEASAFSREWILDWNSHNIDAIMSHYSDDIEITTPFIKHFLGIESGSLKGKSAVRDYWTKALLKAPDLFFELIDVTEGVSSIALYYKSIMNKKAIEIMFFDDNGKVSKMIANYSETTA